MVPGPSSEFLIVLYCFLETNAVFSFVCILASCRMFATALAGSCLTAIIDGMDQSKFRLPRTGQRPSKLMARLFRPALHVVACWCHGGLLNVYVANDNLKKDSNTQNEVLALTLGELLGRCGGQLPLGLHVQMDNCYREGKNHFFLLALLLYVLRGCFRWAAAGFLRTGHSV